MHRFNRAVDLLHRHNVGLVHDRPEVAELLLVLRRVSGLGEGQATTVPGGKAKQGEGSRAGDRVPSDMYGNRGRSGTRITIMERRGINTNTTVSRYLWANGGMKRYMWIMVR
jgi:hypothetical protein